MVAILVSVGRSQRDSHGGVIGCSIGWLNLCRSLCEISYSNFSLLSLCPSLSLSYATSIIWLHDEKVMYMWGVEAFLPHFFFFLGRMLQVIWNVCKVLYLILLLRIWVNSNKQKFVFLFIIKICDCCLLDWVACLFIKKKKKRKKLCDCCCNMGKFFLANDMGKFDYISFVIKLKVFC